MSEEPTDDLGVALQMKAVSKRYPGTMAVDGVDLTVYAGEVHAIIGENGAGKSTLMKMIAGSFDDYTGEIRVSNQPVKLHSPTAAKRVGIQMIHQELSLAAPRSIAENLLAGRLPSRWGFLDRKAMLSETSRWLQQVGLNLDPLTPVEEISQHEAQLVEIAKALSNSPCILVMDEPTSALSRSEVQRLFEIIRNLRRRGLAIIYISHHLPEIQEIADRLTVLRDGRKVGTFDIKDVTSQQMVEMMVGRSVSSMYAKRKTSPSREYLAARGLSRYGFFHDVSFGVRRGEILGVGGLSGAGRSELARSLCGIDPLDEGAIELDGREVSILNYAAAIELGLAYLTEDRKLQGLALRLGVGENMLSAVIGRHCTAGVYRSAPGREIIQRLLTALQVYPPEPAREVRTLSGGNQQKVLLGKWLATNPELLILDEPTRGVDVGAKAVIHQAIADVADAGKSVLLISSDLPELVGLSDRILILRGGHVLGEMSGPECTEESVLMAANGEGKVLKK